MLRRVEHLLIAEVQGAIRRRAKQLRRRSHGFILSNYKLHMLSVIRLAHSIDEASIFLFSRNRRRA